MTATTLVSTGPAAALSGTLGDLTGRQIPSAPVGALDSGANALDGRSLGKRGAATRARLLQATGDLLESNGLRDLRVVDIARAVGTSPATFYQYFRDVEEAVLALAEAVGEQMAPVTEVLEPRWRGEGGLDHARALVDGFLRYWDSHRAVLRTRNLAAQEGDQRFRDVRNESLRPLTEGLSRKVAENEVTGLAPYAAAAALVAMMERMAAFHTDLESYGASRADVVETTARIVFQTVTGRAAKP
jgi:AcrR family transcriptional regulator